MKLTQLESDRLTLLFWLLARDHLPFGVVETLIEDVEEMQAEGEFDDTHLEEWARSMPHRIASECVEITDVEGMPLSDDQLKARAWDMLYADAKRGVEEGEAINPLERDLENTLATENCRTLVRTMDEMLKEANKAPNTFMLRPVSIEEDDESLFDDGSFSEVDDDWDEEDDLDTLDDLYKVEEDETLQDEMEAAEHDINQDDLRPMVTSDSDDTFDHGLVDDLDDEDLTDFYGNPTSRS